MSIAFVDSFRTLIARASVALALAGGVPLAPGVASGQSFTGLGFLPGATESYARDCSDIGLEVVGYGFTPPAPSPTTGFRAFRWTSGGGLENLGTLPGGIGSTSLGISNDGSVVVGWSNTSSAQHAFRWTSAGGMLDLGVPPGSGYTQSQAYGVDDLGSVVVGSTGTNSNFYRAFRWTSPAGPMVNLGTPSGGGWVASLAYGVSGDGSVVVGYATKNSPLAFRWTQAGGMKTLGKLQGGNFSEARAANYDGSWVVGTSDSNGGARAFRWTNNVMTSLGTLPGQPNSYGRAVSGTVLSNLKVVGYSSDGSQEVMPVSGSILSTGRAFLWTSSLGMVDLNTYLPTLGIDLTGWTLREARGISADGLTIVGWGWHDGYPEAWVADLQ